MTKLSRAQTPEEKVAKGEFILQVAERIIRDEGLEALSMNRLVQETGFAKGTLYLYFTTRHEILASLFVQMLTAWHHRLGESLTKARNYDKFCSRYLRELIYDPLFLPMLVLQRRDLETGLPDDTYAQVSLALQQVLGEQAEVCKETLDLTDQLASNLVWAFYTAALGPRNFHNPQTCGPPFRLRCANSKRHYALTHYFAIWWINLHPNPSLRRALLH